MSANGNAPVAGPSRPKKTKKRSAVTPEEPIAPPSKSARVASPTGTGDDFESGEMQLGTGVDPMDALEQQDATMVDPMDAMEANGEDGMEEDGTQVVLPKRADEFEQQAEREVDAAKGLGGEQAEGKMKLVHQVRHQVS